MAEPQDFVLVDDGIPYGGGQIGLARYLRQPSEHRRELVLLAPNRIADDAAAASVPVTVLQGNGTRRGLPLAWVRLLGRHLRAGRPGQVVVANSLMAAIVLAATPKRGRRFVYYMREDFSPGWITGIKYHVVRRLVFPRYDGFLANSRWTGSTLPAGRRPRHVEVAVPLCGVDSPEAPPPPAPSRALRVLSLSRITPWKGIDLALDGAAAAVREHGIEVQLTLAGSAGGADAGYERELRARPLPDGLRVEFTGHVEDVTALLAVHDVLIVASRHPEPFGQVVVQALAWGLSVIASNQGGPADALAEEALGHLVTPDDSAAVADALAAIAAAPPSAEARRESARRARQHYGDATLAAAFERAIFDTMTAYP